MPRKKACPGAHARDNDRQSAARYVLMVEGGAVLEETRDAGSVPEMERRARGTPKLVLYVDRLEVVRREIARFQVRELADPNEGPLREWSEQQAKEGSSDGKGND